VPIWISGSRRARALQGTSWQRNYQSGGVIADETPKDARPATIRLVHDDAHPSRLELGILAPPPAKPRRAAR